MRVLNDEWAVPHTDTEKGVWVTIEFLTTGATLRIFDVAPDRPDRRCLVSYPIPIDEPILPRTDEPTREDTDVSQFKTYPTTIVHHSSQRHPLQRTVVAKIGERLILTAINRTARLTNRFFHTMY